MTESGLIKVKFPLLNKNDWLEDNDAAIAEDFEVSRAFITETVNMNGEKWEEFTHSMLSTWPFLAGKGGHDSLWQPDREIESYMDLTEAERKLWKAECYTLVVEVKGPERTLYVDPSGSDYARYVGVPYQEGDAEAFAAKKKAEEEEAKQQRIAAQKRTEEHRLSQVERGKAIAERSKPAWAQAAILADLEEDVSDPQSDYIASKTVKTIFLAWSKHTKDLFAEMRKAADLRPETAHLGVGKDQYRARMVLDTDIRSNGSYYHKGEYSHWHSDLYDGDRDGKRFLTPVEAAAFVATAPQPSPISFEETLANFSWRIDMKSVERREKYSQGKGFYLQAGSYSGWCVYKQSLKYGDTDIYLALANAEDLKAAA